MTDKLWNRKFTAIFITSLLMYGMFYSTSAVMPIYGLQLGIESGKIGLLASAVSITAIICRPIAGYLLDRFDRYRLYLSFYVILILTVIGYACFSSFTVLILLRLITGATWAVCGSSTMTLAGDTLPRDKAAMGISRFTLTVSLGMAIGPYIGINVQNKVGSRASFVALFAMGVVSFIFALTLGLKYPAKTDRQKFSLSNFFYRPALPYMLNMTFAMIPYGSVMVYSTMFARERNLTSVVAMLYVFRSIGLLVSKLITQKIIDSGRYTAIVICSVVLLAATTVSFQFVYQPFYLLLLGFLLGIGNGVLQPLFQSMVAAITPSNKRGSANATYMLSYDIGISVGSIFIGQVQDSLGIGKGFAITAVT